jgi:hypothetical protein
MSASEDRPEFDADGPSFAAVGLVVTITGCGKLALTMGPLEPEFLDDFLDTFADEDVRALMREQIRAAYIRRQASTN